MRVAMIDPSLFTLPYDAALAEGLAGEGATVRLFGRPLRPGEAQVDLEPVFFRRSERLPARRWVKAASSLGAWRRAMPAIRAFAPDIIHLQWLTAPLLDRRRIDALKRIAPVVATVHDARPYQGAAPRLQRVGWFRALAAADRLLVHHACTAEALGAAGVDGPTSTVPHGAFPTRRVADPEPGLLVQFGALKPYKGHDVMLRALRELPDHRLLVVGPGEAGPLRALAERLGVADRLTVDARFVPDDELDAVLSRADAFVLPYRQADASGALWRVAGYGRPVIASAVGGLAEDLRAEVAELVAPDDPAALAAAILRRDPVKGDALAAAAAERTWAAAARAHLEAYEAAQQPAT